MSTTPQAPGHAPDASTKTVRGLKPRQLTMMGLGGAIGAGLFLGSGKGVAVAGPAILVSYVVAGALAGGDAQIAADIGEGEASP